MPFPLTQEQRCAVDNRGGALLVAAAAGSGKTRVLVERLLDRVACHGANIDRFLIITYTKAAAAELRGRIAQELNLRLAQDPGNAHLRRQTALIYRAHISTIHSFCSALLRESAARLELDPDFRLCDEGEAAVLRDQVLARVMDRQYEQVKPDSDFARLVDTLSAGRDDSRLMGIVQDVFTRIQSHPDPDGWLEEQEQVWRLEGVSDVGQTPWGRLLMEDARRQAQYCYARLEQALELAKGDAVLLGNYGPSIQDTMEQLNRLAKADTWDKMAGLMPVPFPAAGRKKGVVDEDTAQRVKQLRTRIKKLLDKVAQRFADPSELLLADLRRAGPAVRALAALVREFAQDYQEEKRRRSLADFSDLEHLAVKLLCDESGRSTPLAADWSARFDEVMVDEFQDTNQVQNAIFRAVSDGGRKLFMVGDVKQSIYRFRLADPTIFLHRFNTFLPWDQAGQGEGRKVLLKHNFRSRPQVLEGVNDLFRDLMSVELGEMEYTEDQALIPGAQFPEAGDHRLVLDVISTGDGSDEEEDRPDKALAEARNAAANIRRLLDEGFPVQQGDGTRPLTPADVMILLRSPGPVLRQYVQALWEQGIPWSADTGEDFFASTEIQVALSLLRIVDNPRQDVALIGALRSPVYGFSGDRLAQLRSGAKGDFYTAVVQAAQRGEQDCADFLAELDRLRFGAGERTCSQLLWHIYENTNLLGLFSAMPDGDSRRTHLLTLYEVARQQENAGCRTLFDFLLRLDRLQAGGHRAGNGAARESAGVRIMSIHRSKGLEAPVVLVCGLARRFNREDLYQPVLFHPKLGVGPKYLDREQHVELNTLARMAVAQVLDREMMAEELRLLYVAMTRAREKLFLSMSVTDAARVLEGLREDAERPVSPQALAGCGNVGQWILLSALSRRSGEKLRWQAGITRAAEEDYTFPWQVRLLDGAQLTAPEKRTEGTLTLAQQSAPEAEELKELYNWQYEHRAAADVPSKLTATGLKGRSVDREAAQEGQETGPRRAAPLYRPDFAAEKLGLTPAQRGSAVHLAMQYLDFARGDHVDGIRAELDRLVEQEFLTPAQVRVVDPEQLAAVFRSPLGQELIRAERLHREFKFSLLVDAADYYPEARGEEILFQGVVDCWFETQQGITVVDFKSDRVTEQTIRERAEEYRPQLEGYSRALETLTGRPVTRRVLWFFGLSQAVEL